MRIFYGGLGTETNTFAPFGTAYDDFDIVTFNEQEERKTTDNDGPFESCQRWMKETGGEFIASTVAFAWPAGPTITKDYEQLRDELLSDMRSALPLDAVVLPMHGAMVSYGYDDCEGDVLKHVRELVGPDVAVGALLDPHCHLSQNMTEYADIIVFFQEWPHTDVNEAGEKLVKLVRATVEKQIKPVMSQFDCRMITEIFTPEEPVRGFLARTRALEGHNNVLSVSVIHGFAPADVPDMGTRVLVVTDNSAKQGIQLAEQLGMELFGLRKDLGINRIPIDQAINKALKTEGGPVALGEGADNVGGGAPGDSSYLLSALLDRPDLDFAAGVFWDPIAFDIARKAGEGAKIDLRLCGKVCRLSGPPLDLKVKVGKICLPDLTHATESGPWRSITLSLGGADIVISDTRVWTVDPAVYAQAGIDISSKKIIVAKSHGHFHAKFAPVSAKVIYVESEGVCGNIPGSAYHRIKRPKWPFDEDPFRSGINAGT